MEFSRTLGNTMDIFNFNILSLQGEISPEERFRLNQLRTYWNFYEGYHWQDIPTVEDKPQVTFNYCRVFVNKMVSFELGKGFTTKFYKTIEKLKVDEDENTLAEFIEKVWEQNEKLLFCNEMGQTKAICGDVFLQIRYYPKGYFEDTFNEYPKGKISIQVIPNVFAFPEYDSHDRNKMIKFTIQYPIEKDEPGGFINSIVGRKKVRRVIYKQIWTKDRVEIYEGKELILQSPNPYGFLPFVQIKNYPLAGREFGVSDLEDLIPLNTEYNIKASDISEIIDYHSAPVTVVFGAKVSNLQKGVNKIWGGLPTEGRVENLSLGDDLSSAISYLEIIKRDMHEIGSIPEGSLGGEQSISNTSGIALQYANLPLVDRVSIKRQCTSTGLQQMNKMIIHLALMFGLIKKPDNISNFEFYNNTVSFPDMLPKDEVIELQQIETEMRLGLEDREGAMERLGRKEIQAKLARIDEDRVAHPEIYDSITDKNKDGEDKKLNSGITNGDTPKEQLRKETNGDNKK